MIKRFLCTVLVLLLAAAPAYAEEAESADGFQYTVVDGLATVFGYTGSSPDIVIPARIGEDAVTVASIEEIAFWGYTSLRTVFVSPGIRRIGEGAFCECSSLISFVIPLTVSEIEAGTFQACRALPGIDIPRSIRQIGEYAFNLCTSLEKMQIPGTVRIIERYCFNRCSSLSSVTIGEGLERIEASAFAGCTALRQITLPSTLVYLGEDVFYNTSAQLVIRYGGTRRQWEALTAHADGYDDLTVICRDDAAAPVTIAPDAPFSAEEGELRGIPIGHGSRYTSIARMAESFILAPDYQLRIYVPPAARAEEEAPVTTGTVVQVMDPDDKVYMEWTVIIMGDVCETGLLDISQVVRLASMLTTDVSGPAFLAGDWNGSGRLDISDVVTEAALLRGDVPPARWPFALYAG